MPPLPKEHFDDSSHSFQMRTCSPFEDGKQVVWNKYGDSTRDHKCCNILNEEEVVNSWGMVEC